MTPSQVITLSATFMEDCRAFGYQDKCTKLVVFIVKAYDMDSATLWVESPLAGREFALPINVVLQLGSTMESSVAVRPLFFSAEMKD